jgi:hypothetical protein
MKWFPGLGYDFLWAVDFLSCFFIVLYCERVILSFSYLRHI